MSDKKGRLILLSTPIGNLQDITQRAIETLKLTTHFVVEDTRVFRELTNLLNINWQQKKIFSWHDHSEELQKEKIFSWLRDGHDVVLCSDAGSPIVCDPAYPIIQQSIIEGIDIDSRPGVSSLVTAMELSALKPLPVIFHGFLPREIKKKSDFFSSLQEQNGTHYFFEGVSRVEQTLNLISGVLPNSRIAVMRELTKKYQSIYRFVAKEFVQYKEQITYRGEFVIAVEINADNKLKLQPSKELMEMAQNIVDKGPRPKNLAKLLAVILNEPTKEIYSQLSRR